MIFFRFLSVNSITDTPINLKKKNRILGLLVSDLSNEKCIKSEKNRTIVAIELKFYRQFCIDKL